MYWGLCVRYIYTFLFIFVFSSVSKATDDHLLLCEAVVTPTSDEFIEIFNPTAMVINLDDYFLSDDEEYSLLPGITGAGPTPNIGSSDFIVQFPPASTISPNQIIVIAFDGAGFLASFGAAPDFEILGTDAGVIDMISVSSSPTSGLTNGGENISLFHWDGSTDLVNDIDMLNIGTPSSSNDIGDKSGISVDGPDGDTTESVYNNESASMPQQPSDPGFGFSTKRLFFEAGAELAGGNGISGDDETSEDILLTWDTVFTAPDPGICALAVLPLNVVINEVDADTDGIDRLEFVELYTNPNSPLDGLTIVFYNGSDDASYEAYDLDGFSADGNGFFVIGNAGVANVSLVINDDSLQNGADAVAIYQDDAINFPNDTPVTNVGLIDAIVYDTDDSDATELINVLTPGQAQVNERDGGDGTGHSNSRLPDGGAPFDTSTYVQQIPTPGQSNVALPHINVVINEIDADTDGIDRLEFVELYTVPNASLDGLTIVFYNGSDDASYEAYDLDGFSADGNGFFVIGNAGVANVSLVINDDSLQNGADAVAIYQDDAINFPNDTPVTNVGLIDAIVYDTGDSDDTGLINVLTPGQAQVNERDGGNGTGHSNSRLPDGGAPFDTSIYMQQTPTPGQTNTILTISQLQGNGALSPFDGIVVTTNNNIVTAVGPEGFTVQTPDINVDADPETSEGIYVYTNSVPLVVVGDQVNITGEIDEFFDYTTISNNPMITVISSGNPLPAAIVLTTNIPSSDPNNPSCLAGALECFESMLVQFSGITVGPSQSFGSDPIAEATIVVGTDRTFRETGIEFPGLVGLPVWDGNPEIFEFDADKLGLANQILTTGVELDATGVIGYEFGDYELWPTSYSINATPPIPVPVRATENGEMTIASLNLFRFFNDIDDPAVNGRDDIVVSTAVYTTRRAKLVSYIRDVLGNPDILAVQEAESLVVLNDLAADILADSGVAYTAQLIEGNDIGTIDVGFLVRDTMSVNSLMQLGANEIHTFDGSLLHDRPPLLLETSYNGNGMAFDVGIFVIHSRSLNDIDNLSDGDRIRSKRLEQSQSIAAMAQSFQTNNPNTPMILVGDFNAFEFSDGYVDVVGQIRGVSVATDNLVSGANLTSPPLSNQVLIVPSINRYSFNFNGNAQVLDHALTSTYADTWVRGFEYGVGNSDVNNTEINNASSSIRASDHDGFVLFMMTDFDADSIPDDMDNCPVDSNTDQSDVDMDGLGDVCDSCDATSASIFTVTSQTISQISGNVEQCEGINSIVLDPAAVNMNLVTTGVAGDTLWTFSIDLTDPTIDGSTSLISNGMINSTTSIVFTLVGDFDSDLIPDNLDNCPLDANPSQSDVDMDGIGDVCDNCDATLASTFTITSQNDTQIIGTIDQCAGINSVQLGLDATNIILSTTGNPGDTMWTFVIELANSLLNGSTSLIAVGTLNSTTSIVYSINGLPPTVIPSISFIGILIMMLLLLIWMYKFNKPKYFS